MSLLEDTVSTSGCGAAGLLPQMGLAGKYKAAAGALIPGMTMAVTALLSMLNYPTGTSNPTEVRIYSQSVPYLHTPES